MTKMDEAIRVSDLHKRYGAVCAVDGTTFRVHRGEIFGMVGPNGAGKTTTIECIEGLRRPDDGAIQVLGLDPQENGYGLRERIGVQLQEAALPDRLKVQEAMALFAAFYQRSAPWEPLLDELGLSDKRDSYVAKLSGGQKQRLFIALALVNDPELVFLDELTTGLDPQARRAMWDLVRGIRERGATVFLTTHFMEEAERLCDRVAIMDDGRIVALDSPESLVRSLGAESRLVLSVNGDFDPALISALPGVSRIERSGERVIVYGHGEGVLGRVVVALEEGGVRLGDLRTEQPTLDDVFLALTGREMRD
jgi:ABC-2 type transport system ATP-binding protein